MLLTVSNYFFLQYKKNTMLASINVKKCNIIEVHENFVFQIIYHASVHNEIYFKETLKELLVIYFYVTYSFWHV